MKSNPRTVSVYLMVFNPETGESKVSALTGYLDLSQSKAEQLKQKHEKDLVKPWEYRIVAIPER